MKICAIICEYNPFHNGHLYQLRQAKRLSGADAVLCIMSGNFVQRGDAAILEKYTRAKHAVLAGADAVIELPVPFSTSNAELFAKGAVKLLSSIPCVTHLCFGAENANKTAFLLAAKYLNNEPEEVSKKIKAAVADGMSYAKARAQAFAGFIPLDLLSSPNNILGLEYTRALLSQNSNIQILPVARIGSAYNDEELKDGYSSSSAIRAAIASNADVGENLPEFVKIDLPKQTETTLDLLEKFAVLSTDKDVLAQTCDCTEGLENAFKKAATLTETLEETLTSARYTSSRIRRIALQNLLQIRESFVRACLCSPLYLRVLAIAKNRNDVLTALSESEYPLLVRAHDEDGLTEIAKACYEKELFSEKVYGLLYKNPKSKNIFIGKDK